MSDEITMGKLMAEYQRKNYDRINVWIPKGHKDIWKQCAKNSGVSLSTYIVEAVREKMERERGT